jgi:hypothetical protein
MNDTETAVDCGGACAPCSGGEACQQASDCLSGVCTSLVCTPNDSEWANWTPTDPGSTTFETPGNGVVIDHVTGLMWQQSANVSPRIWDYAMTYCENLTLAGYTDWRLPTRIELQSIVDYTRSFPAIDTAVFTGTPDQYSYWTSTLRAAASNSGWVIEPGTGIIIYEAKSYSGYSRCVRRTP